MDIYTAKKITLSPESWDYVEALCKTGKKLEAIKFYRLKTGLSIKESKVQVESYCLKQGFIAKDSFPKSLKIAIPIIGFIILIIIIGTCSKSDTESVKMLQPEANKPIMVNKTWTEILHFKGNGMKKSKIIHLTGSESKIVYSYKANPGAGMGVFYVYVMEAGTQLMKDGGIPEIMSTNEDDQGESSFQKDEGDYYIIVNSVGGWALSIQELR